MPAPTTLPPQGAEADPFEPLRVHLLGQIRIAIGDRVIPDAAWPPRGARTLLLLLLISPRHTLPRERVLDLLWPESTPHAATNALYKALHALRRVLEPDLRTGRGSAYISTEGDLIRIKPHDGLWVDVTAFESGLSLAASQTQDEKRSLLRESLEIYGGDLLSDELYADWPVARREALRQARERASLDLAALDLAAGDPLAPVPLLDALVADDPTLEPAHQALIRAYASAGQPDRARRQYARLRKTLQDELGDEPSAATEALITALDALPVAPVSIAVVPAGPVRFQSIPTPLTPLVGRRREIETVQDLLWRSDVRLVTLLGPGGIGKTRLAIEAANGLISEMESGAAFITLTPVRDPALVLPAIAQAVGAREEGDRPLGDVLRDHLREREALLVLDNMEHVIDAAPAVAELLAGCPGIKMLVTSRERLRLRGEHTYDVPSLSLPNVARLPNLAALARFDAVALFVQTAQAVAPAFELNPDNAATVAAICTRLEGIPLAIELAASRLRHLAPAALLTQLDSRLATLTGGARDLPARQRTLRDTIAWSYDLLSADEQMIFRRLSVFAGGCGLDFGDTVVSGSAGDEPERQLPGPTASVVDTTADLADKSLLRWLESDGDARIGMLEIVRKFGLDALTRAGEEPATRRAHALAFLAFAKRAAPELTGADQPVWLDRVETEHDNLRGALDWALAANETSLALRLAGALSRFWYLHGHLIEGSDWLARALAADDGRPSTVRAQALHGAGLIAETLGRIDRATPYYEEALTIWETLGDGEGAARTLNNLANCALDQGDFPRAIDLHERSLAHCRAIDNRQGIGRSLAGLATVAIHQARLDDADALFNEALPLLREVNDLHSVAIIIANLGVLAKDLGDYGRARARADESQTIWRQLGDPIGIANAVGNLGEIALLEGDIETAKAHFADALHQYEQAGVQRTASLMHYNFGVIAELEGRPEDAWTSYAAGLDGNLASGDRIGTTDFVAAFAGLYAETDAVEAARWFGAALAERARLGAPANNRVQLDHARQLAALHRHLTPERIDTLLTGAEASDFSVFVSTICKIPAPPVVSSSRTATD